ncbi:MAG: AbrB/MazE/SpoVT family DNA-binding domain-containing protein [Akkermansiaceae bacterium]
MNTVTVSPKYQIVIPKAIRERLALMPGDRLEMIQLIDRIELIPVKPTKALRGLLKGVQNTFEREKDRCL